MKKEIVTQVSIKSSNPNWNPVFNSLKVGPDDEGGGSYLKIIGEDEGGEGITVDWEEWDTLVKVVAKYRKDWEYSGLCRDKVDQELRYNQV